MANKKLFAGITAAVAVLGIVAAAGTSHSFINIMGVSADSYTLTMDATGDNSLANIAARDSKVVTTGGNELAVEATGFSAHETAFGTLTTGGTLDIVDMITGVQSLTVNFDGELKVNFGFEAGNYVRTNQPLTTATEYEFGGQAPNYIGLVATKDTTIESIEVDYSCSGVATPTPTLYANLENWFVIGTKGAMNGGSEWDTKNDSVKLTVNTDNLDLSTIEYKVTLNLAKNDAFKIIKDLPANDWSNPKSAWASWDRSEGTAFAAEQLFVDGDENVRCYLAGTYTVYWKGTSNNWNETEKTGGSWISAITELPEATYTTVYYDNRTTNWTEVYAYAWLGSIENATYPGVKMTDMGDGFWSYELNTATALHIIFNDGTGSETNKTSDLNVPEDDKVVYSQAGKWITFDERLDGPAKPNYDLFLKPNANWKQANARFAVYTWDGGEQWFDMELVEDGVYGVDLPDGISNIIFCRMNPGTSSNGWGNKWNQTSDLKVQTDGNNCYTVKEGTWDQGGGTWSTYTPAA